eukprot:Pompholyxophrys_sp_v1_NODE_181_length_1326_cov_4.434304.p4 type:complete len:104 gc:universal NODE_181_length_1326_cov_4.434304:739-428(-)
MCNFGRSTSLISFLRFTIISFSVIVYFLYSFLTMSRSHKFKNNSRCRIYWCRGVHPNFNVSDFTGNLRTYCNRSCVLGNIHRCSTHCKSFMRAGEHPQMQHTL